MFFTTSDCKTIGFQTMADILLIPHGPGKNRGLEESGKNKGFGHERQVRFLSETWKYQLIIFLFFAVSLFAPLHFPDVFFKFSSLYTSSFTLPIFVLPLKEQDDKWVQEVLRLPAPGVPVSICSTMYFQDPRWSSRST